LSSADLEQENEKIIKFYSPRFQIQQSFRDAKQYRGLEDFMNIREAAVTNAANLSLFMVNFSYALMQPFRKRNPAHSVLDLKSHYRGRRYAQQTIKMLPQKPDPILLADIFQQIARLGAVLPLFLPSTSQYCSYKQTSKQGRQESPARQQQHRKMLFQNFQKGHLF
jgi:putative transposase